jgi:hypothetical protein
VEEDVKALPRHPRRRRKTPSEASPWSIAPCLAPWWGKPLICPWVCERSCYVITYSFLVSIYQSSVEDPLMFMVSYHAFREYRSHYSPRTLQYIVIIIGLVMNTFS